uniref:Uncharacterized protein n=1 Tax=Arundo donax TaxID=35708 RepID=A0A0A8XWT9_ARUDO
MQFIGALLLGHIIMHHCSHKDNHVTTPIDLMWRGRESETSTNRPPMETPCGGPGLHVQGAIDHGVNLGR